MFTWLKKLINAITEPMLERPVITTTRESENSVEHEPHKPHPSTAKSDTLTKSGLNKMTKKQLEDYAKSEFNVDLDRRKKKSDLIEQVLNLGSKSSK